MADILYTASLAVVAILTITGLWASAFRDNLLQTLGLAGIGFGCIVHLACMVIGQPVEATRYMVMYGLALYGIGTAIKVYKFRGKNQ